jgi:hypothetical protein
MKLIWFDKDSKQLATERLVFQDDTLTKASEKQCTTISPTEVTNKFRVAKQDIVRLLIKVKQNKINDLQHEANALYNYLGSSTDIIPQQMKGTLTIEPCIELQRVASKTTFDM